MKIRSLNSPVVWVGLSVGALMGIAQFMSGGDARVAVLVACIPVGYAVVVTLLSRRSALSSALAGRPVDERWDHVNLEAAAWTLGISSAVVLAAVIVSLAVDAEWQPYALVGAVMAASYVASLALVSRYH